MDRAFEAGSLHVKINDFTSDAFRCFLEFVYTSSIRDPAAQDLDARELWDIAGAFDRMLIVCLLSRSR